MTRIRIRRGTTTEWLAYNPVLALGEPGFDTDLKVFKVGDGVTPWATLPRQAGDPGPAGAPGRDADTGPRITSVNGNPGDVDGAINMDLDSLLGVSLAIAQTDDEGLPIPGTGPQDGDYLSWEPTIQEWVNKPITGFAPAGWVPPYTLRGVFVGVGSSVPADLPDDALIFDETKPNTPLYALVNTVTASGATLTLPSPSVAAWHDITLTANCTITLPTAVSGARILLLLREDTTGGRTITLSPALKGTTPTWVTTAGTENMVELVSVGGMGWRALTPLQTATGGATAGPTPTVRGVFSANSGASNTQPSASTTLPAGIATGDRGYLLISIDGITKTYSGPPTGWTLVDGPIAAGSQTTWLYSRTMASTDSSAAISTGTLTGSATGRPSMTGIIVAGATATGEVFANNQDTTGDTTLDVPTITPTVPNCLLIHMASVRVDVQSASPTAEAIAVASGWIARKEHYEARWDTTNINFGGYIETKGLSGQSNVAQIATTATYLHPASERSYVIAVPPPVV